MCVCVYVCVYAHFRTNCAKLVSPNGCLFTYALLCRFYCTVIESVLTFSITVWYGNITNEEKDKLNRIVKMAEKIVGCALTPLQSIYETRMRGRSEKIIKDSTHPANHIFEQLPSGRRYRSLTCRTNRFTNSFYPRAIRLVNQK